MMPCMADEELEQLTHRLTVNTTPEVAAALRSEASDRGIKIPELAHLILRDAMADVIERIRSKRQEPGPKKRK